ncbi:MAG: signal recognition particle-docking protein FtsY, partial [Alphaproteobacteria bacterium]|nr:signal recognition particle-docking protein FtsY [Alphaproteobacteria bacterium]
MVSFFQKLGLGLKKSSFKITEGISDIFTKKKVDAQTLEELEELLISADLGVKASSKIITEFAKKRLDKEISEDEIKQTLAQEIEKILLPMEADFTPECTQKPYVVLMVGVNGAGKTTTIGKLASKLKLQGKKVSFIAADTFRAAAVEQLKVWGERSNIRVYSGKNGCDSAGLCYDGLNAAIKEKDDVVFIDTAGRLQNKNGLMDELKKIVKVINKVMPDAPHSTILTIDATTGQNAVSQVEIFNQIVSLNGLIVTKLDGSAKGGILASIAQNFTIPVYFVGV